MRLSASSFLSAALAVGAVSTVSAVSAAETVGVDKRAAPMDRLTGYATLNGGTTGGGNAKPVTITNLAELRTTLNSTIPKVIVIDGIIQGDGKTVDVGPNTSIYGSRNGGGLTNGGFRVIRSRNVILRNLKVSLSPAPTDLILVQNSTNVWIDHNDLSNTLEGDKDFHDGACDIVRGSDFVTVSWNNIHNSQKTMLIGNSETNGPEDIGKLKVTIHPNHFSNLGSRIPSLRFGTGHIYNNYFFNITDSAINSRNGAQTLIEGNVFVDTDNAIETELFQGFANVRDNIFIDNAPELNRTAPEFNRVGTFTQAPYKYTIDPAAEIVAIVTRDAKLGRISLP